MHRRTDAVRAYAVAHLRNVRFGSDITTYLQRIDATLDPYGGRFIIHGGRRQVVEGRWDGALIVIDFPDRASAEGWYESDAYQEILPLRTRNSDGWAILIDGVGPGHVATDVLAGRPSQVGVPPPYRNR
jgi:uncharacterized protein (DUF1330 family)